MNNPFTKLTDVTDENGVLLGVKHSRNTEYGWQLCSYNYHDELNRILKIGRYRYLRKIKKNAHFFVTISLPPDSNLEEIKKVMERIVMKKWIQNQKWYYVFEQRGETMETAGDGLHIHLLILKNKKRKSQCLREIASTFKISKNFVDVREGNTEELYVKRLNYLKGDKNDKKLMKVKIDLLFRQNNNLRDIYTNGSLSCQTQ